MKIDPKIIQDHDFTIKSKHFDMKIDPKIIQDHDFTIKSKHFDNKKHYQVWYLKCTICKIQIRIHKSIVEKSITTKCRNGYKTKKIRIPRYDIWELIKRNSTITMMNDSWKHWGVDRPLLSHDEMAVKDILT
jgi:hypothetical protein